MYKQTLNYADADAAAAATDDDDNTITTHMLKYSIAAVGQNAIIPMRREDFQTNI